MRFGSRSVCSRLALGVSSAALVLTAAGAASANGFEIPENGTEVMARGGAWTAKADSPLAMQLNPAGLAGQKRALLVNSNFTWQKLCYQRTGKYGDVSTSRANTAFIGGDYSGDAYPEVCKHNGLGDVNVVPQIIFTTPINDRVNFAAGIVTPSGTGKAEWDDRVTTANGHLAPSPQRYMLLRAETIILYPTLSVGAAITPQLRVGASLQWGLALLKFSNVSIATQDNLNESPDHDLRADLKANSFFIPAVIAGAMYDVTPDFTIGGMFRWSKDITVTNADVSITGPYYNNDKGNPCTNAITPCVSDRHADKIVVPQPIDARLGFRFHPKRADAKTTGKFERRDSLASELFDVEVDLTYSHNKSFENLGIYFPDPTGPDKQLVAMAGTKAAGVIPGDASVPHKWKDNVGIRVGFEFNAIPNLLALRAGGFLQTSALDPAYAGIDFLPSTMFGGFLGGTYRVSKALDLSAGFGHIFVSSVDNGDGGKVRALVAQETQNPCTTDPAARYRSCEAINSGKYTSSYNMFSLGATIHM
jgi:long-chain fatty acid transport protein